MPSAYADNAWYGPVTVEENVELARDTYRVRFACPEIARRIVPGQFVMLRLADCNDPLLGRPLALYDVVPDAVGNGPVGISGASKGTVPFSLTRKLGQSPESAERRAPRPRHHRNPTATNRPAPEARNGCRACDGPDSRRLPATRSYRRTTSRKAIPAADRPCQTTARQIHSTSSASSVARGPH